jgi:hypothetical protein
MSRDHEPQDAARGATRRTIVGKRRRTRHSGVALGLASFAAISSGLSAQTPPRALLVGVVLDSADTRPIDSARVALVPTRIVKMTDASGEFRLTEIPPGQYVLQFRKFGYRGVNVPITVASADTIERRFILGRTDIHFDAVSVVDPVVVTAKTSGIPSFDDNRRIGLGHFFSRVDLEKQGERNMADVLAGIPGLGIVNGRSGQGYVYSKRMTGSMCPPVRIIPNNDQQSGCLAGQGIYVPSVGEVAQGIQIACYAQVYVDDVLMNRSRPTEPYNLNDFRADQVEAVEYYAGASQIPAKYSALDSRCGVVVLWTRRSSGTPAPTP